MPDKPHVVVLGAGFSGVGVLQKLRETSITLTLIDRNDYHTFQPLLYQVATMELGESEVGYPAVKLLEDRENWTFRRGTVTAIDLAKRTVVVEGYEPIAYDYLVIGLGAVVNFFGTTGAAQHAFPLYSLADAVRLREHILERFASARADPSLLDDGVLTFCVVGGGATGVETAGALAELVRGTLAEDYPDLPAHRAEVHLYERGPHLLAPFKPQLRGYAKATLEERGVVVHLNEGVAEIEPTRIHLHSGASLKAHTLVWGAGLIANPIVESLGVELTRGRVPVGPNLALEGHPDVFVIGDNAIITDGKTNDQLPQLGSVALQAGEHAGDCIARMARNKPTKPFHYRDKGIMATIGYGAAVIQFHRGRTMKGEPAWLVWLGVHLMLLSGGKERGQTILDWGRNAIEHRHHKKVIHQSHDDSG